MKTTYTQEARLKDRIQERKENAKKILIGVGIGVAVSFAVITRRQSEQMDRMEQDIYDLNQNQIRAADAWEEVGLINRTLNFKD